MEKLKLQTSDGVENNICKIAKLFPNCVTEVNDENGICKHVIDFDMLRQELSTEIVEGKDERYQFVWPDKKKAILLANAPINATLRPYREESVDFDNTQNLYIEGDNLDVLKCLKETYLGKVKMIYIDPPYNTGKDRLYKDNYFENAKDYLESSNQFDENGNRLFVNTDSSGRLHTNWLNILYPRLKVARNLLSEDGIIFISIDDNEFSNIKKICDEIFGESNFITNFAVENNPKGRKNNVFVSESYEYCLLYAKNKAFIQAKLLKSGQKKFFNGLITEDKDTRKQLKDKYGVFKQSKRQVSGNNKSNALAKDSKDDRCFTIYYNDSLEDMILLNEYNREKDEWVLTKEGNRLITLGYTRYICTNNVTNKPSIPLYSKATLKQLHKDHLLYFKEDGTIYEKERDDTQQITSMLVNKKFGIDLMTESATTKMEILFGVKDIFNNSKSVDFIKTLIQLYPSNNFIVLDFFSGSSTTAHSTFISNLADNGKRRFIMVQIPELTEEGSPAYNAGYRNICEIGKERIRRAAKKIKEETGADIDYGFRVLKLDSSNMLDVYYAPSEIDQEKVIDYKDNVKSGRTDEDLLFQTMLELGATLDSKIEKTIVNKKVIYNVADGFIVACFDSEVTDEVVKAIAKMQPQYAVLLDSSLADDSTATNFEQIFKTYSPSTTTKIL